MQTSLILNTWESTQKRSVIASIVELMARKSSMEKTELSMSSDEDFVKMKASISDYCNCEP